MYKGERRKRVQLSLPPELGEILERYAAASGLSEASVLMLPVVEFLTSQKVSDFLKSRESGERDG